MSGQDSVDRSMKALLSSEQRMIQWVEQHPETLPASGDGLLVGLMWELHRATGNEVWSNRAETYAQQLEDRWASSPEQVACNRTCLYSHLPWYEHAKDRTRREPVFRAAAELAKRFHHQGRFLGLPDQPNRLALSVLLEVPVSFYTANETLDQDIARHATAHCRTTRDRLLGDDGSVRGAADFQPETTSFVPVDEPCRSRHVALALLGFSQVFGLTNAAEFLKVAERCAEYWLSQLLPDHLPSTTLPSGGTSQSPGADEKDLVAAAVAACSLLELAGQTRAAEHAVAYRSTAVAMLEALSPVVGRDAPPAREGSAMLPDYHSQGPSWLGDFHYVRALRLARAIAA